MNTFQAVVIGGAAAALGTILASKYLNRQPTGGGAPLQTATGSYNAQDGVLMPVDVPPLESFVAPGIQATSPITEAAYNQQPVDYEAAFGPLTNQPGSRGEAVLPL